MTGAMVDRDVRLSMRISLEERDMLKAIAERQGLSASDVVRTLIRVAYAEQNSSAKAPTRPAAKGRR